ncbi:unnamed protein product [Meloidogyne enterolobii]|uniref:Uncharacterized protein n=1 Tax=Meloidogyne enterolobii TaxID=390850 RepID=A0ACB1A601_MELEN
MAIGGLVYKIDAAVKLGMTTILLPKEMEAEFNALSINQKQGIKGLFCDYFEEQYDTIFPPP